MSRPRWHFHTDQVDEAATLVQQFHYSGRYPANATLVATAHEDGGLFGDFGPAAAACVFCVASGGWSEPALLELKRLVRRPAAAITLTQLLAWAMRHIRRHKLADLLVSFADTKQGHHGGIYQAASWNYAGLRAAGSDGVFVHGVFVPGRSANQRWGTRSPAKLTEMLRTEVLASVSPPKHLYWKALTSSGVAKAARLQLTALQYPKPDARRGAA